MSLKLRQDVKPVNAEFTGFCFEYTSFCCKVFQMEGDHGGDLKCEIPLRSLGIVVGEPVAGFIIVEVVLPANA